jgi:4-hydroxybenzoate polyprenyltransferase
MKWSVALGLGRVSNLPTVWTNTLAGAVAAGLGTADTRMLWLLLATSLFYVGGMYLNDAFDREFDRRHRPERPIPAGEVSARAVFTAGFGMLLSALLLLAFVGFAWPDAGGAKLVASGAVLAAAIVLYDWYHKDNPLSPVLMGFCRMMVYVVAAFAITADPPMQVYILGALLLSYLIGLTYIAKQEHLGRVSSLWPLVFLALPVTWGLGQAWGDAVVMALWAFFTAWLLYALSFLRRRAPGDVPRAVGNLLAGICLWDALVIAVQGRLDVAGLALVAFVATLLLQRFVAPT